MAFVLQSTWHDEGRRAERVPGPPVIDSLLGRPAPALRKGAGTVFTLLVHAGLLWVFATRLSGPPAVAVAEPPPARGMVSLTLAPPAPAAPPAASMAAVATAAPQADVDVSTQSALPPPEWTVSTIKPALAGPAAGPTFASAQSAGSGDGGGVYDPFAGAAPLLRTDSLVRDATVNGLVLAGDESGLRLNEAVFESLRVALARSNPALRGTLNLRLRISASGFVLEAAPAGGSLTKSLGAAVAGAFVGKHLFSGQAPGAVDVTLRVAI